MEIPVKIIRSPRHTYHAGMGVLVHGATGKVVEVHQIKDGKQVITFIDKDYQKLKNKICN